jgi:signal transduction histidine kinase
MLHTSALLDTGSRHKLPFWRQFRFALILLFVLLALLPLGLTSALNITEQISQTSAQVTRQLESIADLKSNQIDLWLQQGGILIDIIGTEITARQPTLQNLDGASPVLPNLLRDYAQKSGYFTEIFICNTRGSIVISSSPASVGKAVILQPYFTPSLSADYLQSPYYDVGQTKLEMVITRRLLDENRQVVGILVGRFNLDVLGQIMTVRTGLGEGGETYLVSLQNNFLLTPSRFEATDPTHTYHSTGIDRGLAGVSGADSYHNYLDPPQRVIGVYRWIPVLQAVLLAEIGENQALSPTVQARNNSLIVAGLAALVAVLIGLYYANRVARPILHLTRVTESFAKGSLSERADVGTGNEIGQLAASFNNMADQLASRETELTELNQGLEQRIAERTEELRKARDEAMAASRLAQDGSRLKSEFLSTMSHELRTPMNAIEGFTSIILSKMGGVEYNDKTQMYVSRVNVNSKRLLQLINDFLDLSRVEAGRFELANLPFSPSTAAQRWYDEIGILAEKKGLQFEMTCDPNLPETIYGDEEAISKVALNLLGNAIKFTDQGKVTLGVQTVDHAWRIVVSDTGIGIPPHARDFIFEEFRQVDQTSKRKYGGTGLGLAIVQKYSRSMGGMVTVSSDVGKGSEFTVTLPLKTNL